MKLFVSNDKLPENPAAEDYKSVNWREVDITATMQNIAVKTAKYVTRGDIGYMNCELIKDRSPAAKIKNPA